MGNPGSSDDAQSVDVRRPMDVNMPPLILFVMTWALFWITSTSPRPKACEFA